MVALCLCVTYCWKNTIVQNCPLGQIKWIECFLFLVKYVSHMLLTNLKRLDANCLSSKLLIHTNRMEELIKITCHNSLTAGFTSVRVLHISRGKFETESTRPALWTEGARTDLASAVSECVRERFGWVIQGFMPEEELQRLGASLIPVCDNLPNQYQADKISEGWLQPTFQGRIADVFFASWRQWRTL